MYPPYPLHHFLCIVFSLLAEIYIYIFVLWFSCIYWKLYVILYLATFVVLVYVTYYPCLYLIIIISVWFSYFISWTHIISLTVYCVHLGPGGRQPLAILVPQFSNIKKFVAYVIIMYIYGRLKINLLSIVYRALSQINRADLLTHIHNSWKFHVNRPERSRVIKQNSEIWPFVTIYICSINYYNINNK